MKSGKKIIFVLATGILSVLVGCNLGGNSSSTVTPTTTSNPTTTAAPTTVAPTTATPTTAAPTTVAPTTATPTTAAPTTATPTTAAPTTAAPTTSVSTETPHAHAFGDWEITTKPSATTKGSMKRVCASDGVEDVVELPELTDTTFWTATRTEPTCETEGSIKYTCSYDKVEVTVVLNKIDHVYGEPTYTWNYDYSECTASVVCLNCAQDSIVEKVTTTSVIEKRETCDAPGKQVFTAVFENELFTTQTKDYTLARLGHKYGEPTYTWNEDHTVCTASRVCENDNEHVETEVAMISSKVKTAATCSEKGITTYTAVFKNEAFEKQVIDVDDIPELNHEFGAWTIVTKPTETEEGSAKRVCERDDCGFEDTATVPALTNSDVWTVKETVAPTDSVDGYTIYTSVYGEVIITQSKNGHTYGDWIITIKPTLTEKGIATRECLQGDDTQTQELAELTDTSIWTAVVTAPTHTSAGYTTYSSEYGDVIVEGDPALGHVASGKYIVVKNNDGTASIKDTCADGGEAIGEAISTITMKTNASFYIDTSYSNPWVQDEENTNKYTSMTIGHSKSSYLVLKITESGTISFNYNISSETSDKLCVQKNKDTTLLLQVGGKSSDEPKTGVFSIDLVEGDLLKIYYSKDSSVSYGRDNVIIEFNNLEFKYNTMTYVVNGGSAINPTFIENGVIIGDLPTPTQAGKYFEGWFIDEELQIAFTDQKFTEDSKLYAKWSDEQTLSFDTKGGSSVTDAKFRIGTAPVLPNNPTKEGFFFKGWFTDENCTVKYVPGNANSSFVLYAGWVAEADACEIRGTYNGVYSQTGNDSLGSSNVEFKINEIGEYSLRTGYYTYLTGEITNVNEDGTITYTQTGNSIFLMKYYENENIIVIGYNYSVSTKYYYIVSTNNVSSTTSGSTQKLINSRGAAFIVYKNGSTGSKKIYIDTKTNAVYVDVAFVDDKGNEVLVTDISSKMVVNVKKDSDIIASYYYKSSTEFSTTSDGYAGSYTSADNKNLTLSGAGYCYFTQTGATTKAQYEVVSENVVYVYYSSTYRYLVTLDTVNKSFTYEDRKVNITLDYGYEVDGVEKTSTFTWKYNEYNSISDSNPTRDGYIFKGWYTEEDGAGTKITGTKAVTEDTTFYAYWVEGATLKVYNDNGGTDPVTSLFEKGTKPTLTKPSKDGYVFVGWFTNLEKTIEYVDEVKTSDVTVYAKWEVAPYYMGTFYGLNSDDGPGAGASTKTASTSYTFVIKEDDSASGKWTTKIKTKDLLKGEFVLDNNSKVQITETSDGMVFLITDYSSGCNYACDDDFMIYAKTSSSSLMVTKTVYWLDGYQKIIEATIGAKKYYIFIDGYDGSKNPKGGVAYVDVVLKNFSGEAITFESLYNSTTKAFAPQLAIYKADGTTLIAMMGGTANGFVTSDGKSGTYTGTIDGVANSTVALDGYGKCTLTINENSVVGTYKFNSDGKLILTISQKEYKFTMSEFAITQVLDGKEGTYTLGDKLIVISGWGTCTVDGEEGTYTIANDNVKIVVNSVSTTYSLKDGVASIVEDSIFSGLTFTGKYYSEYWGYDCNINVVFNSGAEISGKIIDYSLGRSSPKEFVFNNGVFDETTGILVVTLVSTDSGATVAGKTLKFQANGHRLSTIGGTYNSNTYTFKDTAQVDNNSFNFVKA